MMTRTRTWRYAAAALGLSLAAAACGGGADTTTDATDGDGAPAEGSSSAGSIAQDYDLAGASYAVGSKDFTEQLVLGHVTRLALEAAGADVQDRIGLAGTAAARDALTTGEIDMYWEYNGTGWGIHLDNELGPDALPEDLTGEVARLDLEQNGIRWLDEAPFNNTYALAVRDEVVGDVPMTISEIAASIDGSEQYRLCVESEFSTREDSLPGLEEFYDFDWPDELVDVLDTGVVYTQTDKGDCTYGEVFASDGRIAALGLTLVEDDLGFFPPYNPALNVREEAYEAHPEIGDLFADIAASLDLETMQRLNAAVDVDGEFPEDVARQWLVDEGFLA